MATGHWLERISLRVPQRACLLKGQRVELHLLNIHCSSATSGIGNMSVESMFQTMLKEQKNILDSFVKEVREEMAGLRQENERLRSQVSSLEDRLAQLEAPQHSEAGTARHAPRTDDVLTTPNVVSLSDVIAEEMDIMSRKDNIITKGIPEEEEEDLKHLCSTVLKVPSSRILEAERVGRNDAADDNDDSTAAQPDTTPPNPTTPGRLIKVRFVSSATKSGVYKGRFKLKFEGEPIYVSNDLTKAQQRKRRGSVALYKELRQRKVKCMLPHDVILHPDGSAFTEQELEEARAQPAPMLTQ